MSPQHSLVEEAVAAARPVLVRKARNLDEADELAQELALKVLTRNPALPPLDDVGGYARTVALSLLAGRGRRRKSVAADGGHEHEVRNIKAESDPSAEAEIGEACEIMRAAFDRLRPTCRSILNGVYWHGEKVGTDTRKAALFRARQRLAFEMTNVKAGRPKPVPAKATPRKALRARVIRRLERAGVKVPNPAPISTLASLLRDTLGRRSGPSC